MRPATQAMPAHSAAGLSPPDVEATAKLAVQYHNSGDLDTAEKLYGHVLLVQPLHPLCLQNLGLIRLKRNDVRAGLDLLQAAAQAAPDRPQVRCTLGAALLQTGDADAALDAFLAVTRLHPGHAAGWDGLGMVLRKSERLEEALAAHRRALQLDPASRLAARNLGNALVEAGQLEQAERLYQRLLDENPLDPDIVIQRGIVRLARGDFRGWSDYAWSHWSPEWLQADLPVLVPLPQWDGEALPGRGLLLYGEQGIGDEIMFASLVPAAAARAGHTALLCEPRLVPLFARSFPGLRVAAKPAGGRPPLLDSGTNCERRCSLSRLAATLGAPAVDTGGTAYLRADPAAIGHWRQRLDALGSGLKVGISWRGGHNDGTRARRSLDLQTLAPLFSVPGTRFVNVQYGDHAAEIADFNRHAAQPLHRFEEIDPLRDMDGLSALLSALDLVISVDNSTVHLAAALGARTWMLCPFNANWRWTQQGETSHWYHSLRLFRQHVSHSSAWQPVIGRVAEELRQIATAPATGVSHAADATRLPARPVAAITPHSRSVLASSPSVMLINDTAYWYHWGCTGTSLALHEELRARGHVVDSLPIAIVNQLWPLPASAAELDDDALFRRFSERNAGLLQRLRAVTEVIINGEGSIHDLTPTARALLYVAWICRRRLAKHTSIINHSCFPRTGPATDSGADELYARVYGAMDHVAVREDRSATELARLGIRATQSFDCLPLFIARHALQRPARERRVVICGSVAQNPGLVELLLASAARAMDLGYSVDVLTGASAFIAQDDLRLVGVLHPRLRGRYRFVAATSERQWLDTIAGASLVVSGRFHHSIAAACLGTPFVVAASNTSKIDGMIDRLGLERDAVWISPGDRTAALSRIESLLADPAPALVPAERLAALREMSLRNFDGVPPRREPGDA